MLSSLQVRRADEKLGFVLERVDAIRRRLNSLAWQRILFGVPAGIITAGALVALAAFFLSPLAFLTAATALGACLAVGLFRTVRRSWRMRVDDQTAASVADERAGLKGRLETIVQIGCAQQCASGETEIATEPPSLWSYLIEDTLESRDEFEPARIECRRFSRSLYLLFASLAFAAAIVPLIARVRARPAVAAADGAKITLDLQNLHLRRLEPGSEPGLEAQADAETMGRLEEKMAAEGYGTGASKSSKSLLDRARRFAGDLQRKLTGRSAQPPRITLKLADASSPGSGMSKRRPKGTPPSPSPDDTNPSRQGRERNAGSRPLDHPGSSTRPGANPGGAENPFGPGAPQKPHSADRGGGPATNPSGQANRGQAGGSGVSHGSGAAPETLFGSATEPKTSGDGFEIAIEAPPMPDGSRGGARGHLPPKVRAQLNAEQHSDEPIARAAVPEEDRAAIKQVFER